MPDLTTASLIDRLRTIHTATHPAASLDVAMAAELARLIPSSKITLH